MKKSAGGGVGGTPPGTHWTEVRAVELPVVGGQLPAAKEEKRAGKMPKPQNAPPQPTRRGPRQFGPPPTGPIVEESVAVAVAPPKKPPKPRAKVKTDPQFVAAARELRDRYLEHVNTASPLAPRARY